MYPRQQWPLRRSGEKVTAVRPPPLCRLGWEPVNGNVTVRQVVLVRGGQEAPRTQGGTKSLGATSLPTAEIVRLGGAGVNAAGAEVGVPQQVYWGVLERIGGYGRRRSSSRPFGRRRTSPLGGGLSPQRGEWSWGSLERTGWQSTMGRAYKRTALAAKRRLTRHVVGRSIPFVGSGFHLGSPG